MLPERSTSVGYVELVRTNANFRYLWLGQIVSLLGDWFNLIASATLIAQLTGSGVAVSGLFVVRLLAPFLVSSVAGVAADRYNRKHILILTDIGRALTLCGFFFVREAGDIWLLYTLTALQFSISGFFTPTKTAILPDLVSERELGAANALTSATWSVMLSLGAALGGLVSGLWGIYPAFAIDALTFLVSALFVSRIRLEPVAQLANRTLKAALQQYVDGLRYLGRHPQTLVNVCHKAAVAALSGSTFEIVQVAISERVFTIGVGGGVSLGLMFMMTGIGSGIGPIAARRVTKDRPGATRWAIALGYLMIIVGYTVVAPLFTFGLTLTGILLRGLGGGVVWVFSTQLLFQQVPAQVRGRVFASEFALFMLSASIAAVLVGRALDLYSISTVITGLAGLVVVPLVLWTLWVSRYRPDPASERS